VPSAHPYSEKEEKEPFGESFVRFVVQLEAQLGRLKDMLPFNVTPITRVLSCVGDVLES
jgi:hypothetical protein